MELIQTTNLHFHDFKSDKVYYAELCKIPKSNLWNIHFAYGRRGNTLVHGTKNEQPLPYNKAAGVYMKLVNSKVTKGYNYTASSWVSDSRTRTYSSFAAEMVNEKYMTEEEYTTVTRMLYSNDPETVKLAEVLIETKEKQRWEQN
jgi:bifunctional non-homologous end joining protein LigD